MRNTKLIGLVFVAVCAFSAFVATSAFALTFEPALFLINGLDITGTHAATQKGGLLLENVLSGGAILCEGIFDETLGPESSTVTAVLTTGGGAVAELDEKGATGGITCTGEKICENGSEVWALKLPWTFDARQDVQDGTFWLELLSTPEYAILCLFLGASIEELCKAILDSTQEVLNVTAGIEAFGPSSALGPCNENTEDGLLEADAGNLLATTEASTVLSISLNASKE